MSLDWLTTNDYDAFNMVFEELTFLKQITLLSDAFTSKDMDKLEQDYDNDLKSYKSQTKAKIAVLLKTGEDSDCEPSDAPENKAFSGLSLSRDPKQNVLVSHGLSEQVKNNTNLIELKIVYWRLHPNVWKALGTALGKHQSLVTLTLQGCALDEGDNMQLLFTGQRMKEPPLIDYSKRRKAYYPDP